MASQSVTVRRVPSIKPLLLNVPPEEVATLLELGRAAHRNRVPVERTVDLPRRSSGGCVELAQSSAAVTFEGGFQQAQAIAKSA